MFTELELICTRSAIFLNLLKHTSKSCGMIDVHHNKAIQLVPELAVSTQTLFSY